MGTHPIFESDFDCLTDPDSAYTKWLNELKGRYRWKVRNSIWRISKKDRQEDGSLPTQKIPISLLGATTLKRTAVGIWHCSRTNKKVAGGAWEPHTQNYAVV